MEVAKVLTPDTSNREVEALVIVAAVAVAFATTMPVRLFPTPEMSRRVPEALVNSSFVVEALATPKVEVAEVLVALPKVNSFVGSMVWSAVHVTEDAAVTNPGLVKVIAGVVPPVEESTPEAVTEVTHVAHAMTFVPLHVIGLVAVVEALVINPVPFVKYELLEGIVKVRVAPDAVMFHVVAPVEVAKVNAGPVEVAEPTLMVVVATPEEIHVEVENTPVALTTKQGLPPEPREFICKPHVDTFGRTLPEERNQRFTPCADTRYGRENKTRTPAMRSGLRNFMVVRNFIPTRC